MAMTNQREWHGLRYRLANIITSIRNVVMDKNGTVRIASTNIAENIVKISR